VINKKADFYSYYGGSMGEYIQGYAAKRTVLFLLIIVLSVISYGIIGRILYQCMKHIQKIATDEGDMIVAQKAKWSWRRIKFDALCMAGIALFLLITGESRSTPVPNIILSIIFLIALLDILLRSMRLINKLNGIQEQTLKESCHPKKWDKVYCSVVVADSLFGMIAAILGYSSMKDFTYRMVEEQEGDFITVGNLIFCYQGGDWAQLEFPEGYSAVSGDTFMIKYRHEHSICEKLQSVIIPPEIQYISSNTFKYCSDDLWRRRQLCTAICQ